MSTAPDVVIGCAYCGCDALEVETLGIILAIADPICCELSYTEMEMA